MQAEREEIKKKISQPYNSVTVLNYSPEINILRPILRLHLLSINFTLGLFLCFIWYESSAEQTFDLPIL